MIRIEVRAFAAIVRRRRIRTRGVGAGVEINHAHVGAGRGQQRHDREDQETSFLERQHVRSPSGARARDTLRRRLAERGHLSLQRFAETSRILCPSTIEGQRSLSRFDGFVKGSWLKTQGLG